jgi:RNA polymerase sigma factor (sigma-70 family)
MSWNKISVYILQPKFKELCCNIAKRSGLHDDLYQELILTLLEKIESHKEPLLKAWENKYIDWYIVSTADRIFRSNHSVVSQLRFVSTSTGSTEVQSHDETEAEIEFDSMVKLCETELAKEYWYNSQLFRQYAYQDNSIRKIEKKTGIPRNSIHRTLKETRERLRETIRGKIKMQEA